jgi:hypothetical protein
MGIAACERLRPESDAERRDGRSHAERGNEKSRGVRRENFFEAEFLGKQAQKMTKSEPPLAEDRETDDGETNRCVPEPLTNGASPSRMKNWEKMAPNSSLPQIGRHVLRVGNSKLAPSPPFCLCAPLRPLRLPPSVVGRPVSPAGAGIAERGRRRASLRAFPRGAWERERCRRWRPVQI